MSKNMIKCNMKGGEKCPTQNYLTKFQGLGVV